MQLFNIASTICVLLFAAEGTNAAAGGLRELDATYTAISNSNFKTACTSWVADPVATAVTYGPIADWDTSSVITMSHALDGAVNFNENVSAWDVGNVVDFSYLFKNNYVFDQDLSNWDTSKAATTSYMFYNALVFNSDISSWDVGLVGDLSYMFFNAAKFNIDLTPWNIISTTTLGKLFSVTIFI
jgi:hypothetical protein